MTSSCCAARVNSRMPWPSVTTRWCAGAISTRTSNCSVETSLLCRKHGVLARTPKCALLGIPVVLACSAAQAANWEFAPRVEAGYRYNDNYRLDLPGGEIEVSGAEGDAALTIRTLDPRTHFEITPRIQATYFPD